MENLTVLKGGLSQQRIIVSERKRIMANAYQKMYFSNKYGYDANTDIEKAIFCGVRYYARIDINDMDYRELLITLLEIMDIKSMIAGQTLKSLMKLFPAIKSYDGKGQSKDYYSTMEYISEHDADIPVGIDGTDEFLWNYYNYDIMNFSIKEMLVMDRMARFEGRRGLLESFISDMGLENTIHTYTIDRKNNTACDNITGERFKLKEPKIRKNFFQVIRTEKDTK